MKKSNFFLLRIWDFTNIHSRGQKHWEYVESIVEQFKKLGLSFKTAVINKYKEGAILHIFM